MNAKRITVILVATILSVVAIAGTTAKKAKISMETARKIALKKAPGTVKSEELEEEHGKLIYSFDIETSETVVTEVTVDAMNGKIVSVEQETPEKEAQEKQDDDGRSNQERH